MTREGDEKGDKMKARQGTGTDGRLPHSTLVQGCFCVWPWFRTGSRVGREPGPPAAPQSSSRHLLLESVSGKVPVN